MSEKNDELYVLEVNSLPGLHEPSTVDDILKLHEVNFVDFLTEALFK